jgi:hypothetical protein
MGKSLFLFLQYKENENVCKKIEGQTMYTSCPEKGKTTRQKVKQCIHLQQKGKTTTK